MVLSVNWCVRYICKHVHSLDPCLQYRQINHHIWAWFPIGYRKKKAWTNTHMTTSNPFFGVSHAFIHGQSDFSNWRMCTDRLRLKASRHKVFSGTWNGQYEMQIRPQLPRKLCLKLKLYRLSKQWRMLPVLPIGLFLAPQYLGLSLPK